MRYIGIDVGDGESAVAVFEQGSGIEPNIWSVCGTQSVLSAVGTLKGEIVIGDRAYTEALADGLSVRFKSRFTQDVSSYEDIVKFVRGLLNELREQKLLKADDHYVIGCPAGWNAACRMRYRELMLRAGVAEPQVISESRAAFLYAKYAKTVALDVDVLNQSALVVDIGSSTLDFAYIVDGRETGVGTFGDIALGGGLLDAELLRRAVEQNPERDAIRAVFAECRSWYSYCEIEARRLKEEYFTRQTDDPNAVIKKQLRICYDGVQRLAFRLDAQEMSRLVDEPMAVLGGQSFSAAVEAALQNAARVTADRPPKLVLLTGGASRMPFFRELCRSVFNTAAVVCCPEPEFSIAKGLSYAGWVDENLRAFREAIQAEVDDKRVSAIARDAMTGLMPEVIDTLTDLLIEQAAIPVAHQWKCGQIDTIKHMNDALEEHMTRVFQSPMTEEALAPALSRWLEGLSRKLQTVINPICDRYEVPRRDMQLNLTASGNGNVAMDAGELMRLPVIGTVMGVIVSVLTGLLCGGSGLALISAGPIGFLAGLMIGTIISIFGWTAFSDALMKAKIPAIFRRVNLEKRLRGDATRRKIRIALQDKLGAEDSTFQRQVVEGFTKSFRGYLYGIAQAAEIPIE